MTVYASQWPAGHYGLVGNHSKVPPAMPSDGSRIISGGYPPLPVGVSS